MALLLPLVDGAHGDQIAIAGDRAVLGRHPECDIVLDAAAVSRQHAQISHAGGENFIEDLHSRNGTFVNGRLVQGRVCGTADGDRLKICDLLFTCYRKPPVEAPRSGFSGGGGSAELMTVDNSRLALSDGGGLSGAVGRSLLTGGGSPDPELYDEAEAGGSSTIMSKLDVMRRRRRRQSSIPR